MNSFAKFNKVSQSWRLQETKDAEARRLKAEKASAAALLKQRSTLMSRIRHALFVVDSKGDSTKLTDAAFEGDINTVQVLLLEGWNLESASHDGYTALSEAACAGQIGVVQMLLDLGADPNTCGTGAGAGGQRRTPLSRALCADNLAIAKLLLQAGAFARAARAGACWISRQGMALLNEWDVERSEAAQEARRKSILKTLQREVKSWSPADRRLYRLQRCRSKLLRLAESGDAAGLLKELHRLAVQEVEYGADTPGVTADTRERVADGEGRTLLALAAFHNHSDVVQMLVTQWREIATSRNSPSKKGRGKSGHFHRELKAKKLKASRNSPSKKGRGKSGHLLKAKKLKASRNRPSKKERGKNSHFHRELKAKKLKAMQLKVFRVDVNARFGPFNGADGWTAFSLAAWKGHAQIVQLLRMHGANPLLGTSLSRDAFAIANKSISLFSRGDKLGNITTRLLTNAMQEHVKPSLGGGSDKMKFLQDRKLNPLSTKLLQQKQHLLLEGAEKEPTAKAEVGANRSLKSMRTAAKDSSFYDLCCS